MRAALVATLLLRWAAVAGAQDVVEAMPSIAGLDADAAQLASSCGASDAPACTSLADLRLHAGDGTSANALYRRAADLARLATTARTVPSTRTTVRSGADAIAALEASWDVAVVSAAASHGLADYARGARPQIFGPAAVTAWTARRARRSDAFRTVHAMRTREGAVFAQLAWIGDLAALAAPGDVWELRFAWMNLDFVAHVADDGTVVALVHVPEG